MPGEQVVASGAGYRPNRTVTLTGTTSDGSRVVLGSARANGDGVFTVTFVMPDAALSSVTTDNAAAPDTPAAESPLHRVDTPHGTKR
jgi:hypothetical protein